MTFAELQCPNCRAKGNVQVLPWRTSPGETFGLSFMCDVCDHFAVVDVRAATEVLVGDFAMAK